jgi:hypothetical protein
MTGRQDPHDTPTRAIRCLNFLALKRSLPMSDQQPPRRGRGRPSKGPRKELHAELPIPLAHRLAQAAEEQGVTKTDLVTAILREHFAMQDRQELSA